MERARLFELGPAGSAAVSEEMGYYQPCEAVRLQVEGDLSLLTFVLAQIRASIGPLPLDFSTKVDIASVVIPDMLLGFPKKEALDPLRLDFVRDVKRSDEGVINSINYNNYPIARIYLYDSAPKDKLRAREEIRRLKDFIRSNYDRAQVEKLLSERKKQEDKEAVRSLLGIPGTTSNSPENDMPLKTRWAVFCVGRVSKDQQKRIKNFVRSPPCANATIIERSEGGTGDADRPAGVLARIL